MTSPSGMSCETCRDLLIELVCDELAAEMAAAVRAHALKCERCGAELEKLSGTLAASRDLELLSPSPELERRIMQAAREAIAGRGRGPAREATQGASYGITAWFARLGSFAMSPQVAMASVLLLVVGIGLYALPFGRNAEHGALHAAEDEAEGEHIALPGPVTPAPAAPLAQDDRSVRDEEQARASASTERALPSSSGQGAKDGSGLAAPRAGRASSGELARRAAPSTGRNDLFAAKEERGAIQAFPGSKGAGGAVPSRAKATKLSEADDGQASAQGYARAPMPAPATAAPRSAQAPSAPSEAEPAAREKPASKRAADAATSVLDQGIAAVQRGDHAAAEGLLKPLLASGESQERATATLWLARSLRERGDCARALPYYRVLTQELTASRTVLEEAADCQARVGNAAAAERLRARAALPAKR